MPASAIARALGTGGGPAWSLKHLRSCRAGQGRGWRAHGCRAPQEYGRRTVRQARGRSQSAAAEARQSQSARTDGQHLEQFAHLACGPASRSTSPRSRSASPPIGRPRRGARRVQHEPMPSRNSPCVSSAASRPCARAHCRESGEIDMGGQVGLAGIGQRVRRGGACVPPAACRRAPARHGRSR